MKALPSLRQLRYLDALARERHFGRAAERCAVTQSSLSGGIQELEALLEAQLVERTKRRVALTPLGEEIVQRARRVLVEAEHLADLAAAAREPLTGRLRMGVIPTIAPFLLPRLLPELRRAYPRLQLFLKEDLTARLVDDLRAGVLDVLLIALPYDCGEVETSILFDDAFQLACHKDHPLARSEQVPLDAVPADSLFLLQDGHCLREHALSACDMGGDRHQQSFEATSLHTLVQMVDNRLGITLLPQLAIDAGILDGTDTVVRAIAGEPQQRQIGLVWRSQSGRNRELRMLADFLTEAHAALVGGVSVGGTAQGAASIPVQAGGKGGGT
ncbi:LysR family hydrogen peroxide-inducible transcriptional activator [Constrictibacter sp. MBR-5]|jgi:LysR family hydrogen peroxide-inducible transcriptional activator|uniref:hydrogen peroxide-inducible genes activator n=1 Tax=Constrictibacter sp. MBR-5 TaxID=3156467 RepID=UPI0033962D41